MNLFPLLRKLCLQKDYQKAVGRILLDEKINVFFENIEDFLKSLPPKKGSFIYYRDKYEAEKRKKKRRGF